MLIWAMGFTAVIVLILLGLFCWWTGLLGDWDADGPVRRTSV